MRTILVTAATALGLALAGIAPIAAAPAHGIAIGHAAHVTKSVHQVQWHRQYRHHRHCWVGWHGRLHCWW